MRKDESQEKNPVIEHNAHMYYACCPVCKNTLIQAKKGLDCVIKCGTCKTFISIKIDEYGVVSIKIVEHHEN